MADFFQSLSAIGDTLVNNRDRAHRERTLADLGQYFDDGPMDYKTLGARLIAAGDIRSGLLALRIGETRDAGSGRRVGAAAERVTPAAAPGSLFARRRTRTRVPPEGIAAPGTDPAPRAASGAIDPQGTITALITDPSMRERFDAQYGPGASARILGLHATGLGAPDIADWDEH